MKELLQYIEQHNLWQEELELKRHAFLLKEGDANSNLFFVVKGAFRVYTLIEDHEQIIRFAYKNSVVSALDTYIAQKPTRYYIQAIKHSVVKVIAKDVFEQLIHSNTHFLKVWNEILLQFMHQMMEREIDLLTQSPTERYRNLLVRSPQVFQEIPAKYIASYLRMSPETLSRIQKS